MKGTRKLNMFIGQLWEYEAYNPAYLRIVKTHYSDWILQYSIDQDS